MAENYQVYHWQGSNGCASLFLVITQGQFFARGPSPYEDTPYEETHMRRWQVQYNYQRREIPASKGLKYICIKSGIHGAALHPPESNLWPYLEAAGTILAYLLYRPSAWQQHDFTCLHVSRVLTSGLGSTNANGRGFCKQKANAIWLSREVTQGQHARLWQC